MNQIVVTSQLSTSDVEWAADRPLHHHPIPHVPFVPESQRQPDALRFSLSFFANDEDALAGPKYRLLLDAARRADAAGLHAIWFPERHFHSFGGLYPSPTAIGAALATATERIGLRAGSVVLPLHDPIRVAEEWSVIDNLSGGRVGVSFASGWHADDFVLAPDSYAHRRDVMVEGIQTVRSLWRGETIERPNGAGERVKIAIRPRPVQAELPFWFTAAGSPDTFRAAGRAGGFVLTNLMGHTLEQLAGKVELYRRAWHEAGHDASGGHVTLMLHALLADDASTAHAVVRDPLISYFRSSVDILRGFIASQGLDIRPEDLSPADMQTLLEHGVQRYLADGGLFGGPDDCAPMLARLHAAGVDEVAALIDFGVPIDAALRGVDLLGELAAREHDRASRAQRAETSVVERRVDELAGWLRDRPDAAVQATPDTLAWLLERAPQVLAGRTFLTQRADVLGRVAAAGGLPLIPHGSLAPKAFYGPGGEISIRPRRAVTVVDDRGRPLGVGLVGLLAPEGEQATAQRARWRTDGTLELLPSPAPHTAPLSFAQQRLWSLDHLIGQKAAYNNPMALRLSGELDVAALESALRAVVRRHEVLRTTFPATADGAIQLIHKGIPVSLPVLDASGNEVDVLARDFARLPFDLEYGPVWRAQLLRLSDVDHVLLICLHHIVSDGWSAGVLASELAALYVAFSQGQPSPLPPLPAQYADYTVWQRGLDFSRQLDYWRRQLAGAPLLELPLDRPRGPAQTHDGARHPVRLDRDLTGALKARCAEAGVTVFMALQAGLVTMLHRYTGQDDIVTGTSVAGRSRPDFEPLVGVFVNSVVLRTDVTDDPTFLDLLGRVKTTALDAFAHAEVPFERLVDELKPPRDLSLSPLFQAMMVWHNTPAPQVRLGPLTLEALEIDPGVSKLDLMLELREDDDGIGGAWEFNTDLFDEATIEQLTRHLVGLLSDAVTDPRRPISRLELMQEREREALLALSRGVPLEPVPFTNVAEAFQAHATLTPDALAVGDDLTYGALEARSNQLAHALRERGVRPGTRVALLLERPEDAITAMFGVLKSGGAYVPIDPHAPAARREELLSLADPVVTASNLDAMTEGMPTSAPSLAARGDDPAYLIFTSGSTGRPKGVVVSHAQLLYSTWARVAYYGGPAGRCVAPYPLTFDASVGWIYYALLTGGTLWVGEGSDPRALARLVRRVAADRFSAVPAVYASVLEAARDEPGALSSLQSVSVIGERCPPELVRAHLAACEGAVFHNEYGPTEATVWCTSHPLRQAPTGEVPVGRPIPGALAWVCDAEGEVLPVGAVGELLVGGPGVAIGYWREPELTAKRFVDRGSTRFYRTGDLARWNRRGELEFLGRVDRQVKVRGFRVEPAEIESALASHPTVVEAAVVPRTTHGTTALVGYVVHKGQGEDWRAFLRERLPGHLVPAEVVTLPALPRTRNGKLDIAALPEPDVPAPQAFVAPRDDTERTLAEVISQVLGGKPIGIYDDFFAAGGDSMLAITVITRARRAGLEVEVRQLFQHPTVASLATVATPALLATAADEPLTGPVPLSPNQRRFFEFPHRRRQPWNGGVHLELTETLDIDQLERAFHAVLRHHDALRLRFAEQDGVWRAHYAEPDDGWRLRRVDLSEAEHELTEQLDRMQAAVDLTNGPLLTAAVVHLGHGRPDRLVMGAHHLVIDTYSWHLVIEDLFAAYRGEPLPAKTTPYRDWSEAMAGYRDPQQLAYWSGLAYDRAARLPLVADGAQVESATAVVRTHMKATDGDIPAKLVTAVASALADWTSNENVHLDLQHHGRADLVPGVDLTRTVGWFSVAHPVVVRMEHEAAMPQRLSAVKEFLAGVPYDGSAYPALRFGSPDSPLRAIESAEVIITYQGRLDLALSPGTPARLVDQPVGRQRHPGSVRRYPLSILAGLHTDRLWLAFSYAESTHHRATIERLAERVTEHLRSLT